MDFEYQPKNSSRRFTGFAIVVLLHALILYGLVSGLARKAVEVIKKPLEAKIIEEIKPPPPQAPPPPYVPPPEVTPPPAAEPPAITTQVEPPREPVKIEPPPPAPAPPAPKQERVEVSIVCPGYGDVLRGSLGAIRDKVGIDGVVTVRIKIRGSQVVEVTPMSGPREYFRPVQNAVRKFSCQVSGQDEVVTSLEVVFKEQ